MGNGPSQALASVNPAGIAVKNAAKNVNQQLGLGGGADAEAEAQKKRDLQGVANRKEQELRQKERATEYKHKQMERETRKLALKQKWEKSHQDNSESSSK